MSEYISKSRHLNGDNKVDVIDLVCMKKAQAGQLDVTDENDIVKDNVVDEKDLQKLRSLILE